jgi:hypothetical protein
MGDMENGTKPCFGGDNVPSYFPQKEFQPSVQFKFSRGASKY